MKPGAVTALLLASLPLAVLAGEAADGGAMDRGEQIYSRCAACHAIEFNRTGPRHCGLFGRRAGTVPGFTGYSRAMRDSKIVWTASTLDEFLRDPIKAVPGTAMGYAGVKDPKERAELIAWLREATRPGQSCKPSSPSQEGSP